MKIKNKFLLGFYLIILICILCGCGLSSHDKNTSSDKENLYNDNDKIVQEDNDYYYRTYGDDRNNNEIEIKYSGFSGIDTIYFLEVDEDTEITLSYDSKVNSGKFKEVLINPNNEAETIVEGTEQSSKTIKLTKGKYNLKNVGANTEGKIKININSNSDIKITKDKK